MKKRDKYRCPHCGRIIERDDLKGKKWYKSFCDETYLNVHMMLIKNTKK